MRLFVLLLVLANVAVLAWARYGPGLSTAESQLVAQQIRPEAIHLLTAEQVAAKGRAAVTAPGACVEWGAFSPAELARSRAAAEALVGASRITERAAEETTGWWVYMASQGTRQAANQKVAELRRLGVEEYFIVQEDPKFRFAISLGIYRTEEAARTRLEQLRAQGVRTAQIGPRQAPVPKVFLQLRDVPADLRPKLAELKDASPGTDLKECAL